MYSLHIPVAWESEARKPQICLASSKFDTLLLIWTKFDQNLSIAFVLKKLTDGILDECGRSVL